MHRIPILVTFSDRCSAEIGCTVCRRTGAETLLQRSFSKSHQAAPIITHRSAPIIHRSDLDLDPKHRSTACIASADDNERVISAICSTLPGPSHGVTARGSPSPVATRKPPIAGPRSATRTGCQGRRQRHSLPHQGNMAAVGARPFSWVRRRPALRAAAEVSAARRARGALRSVVPARRGIGSDGCRRGGALCDALCDEL